MELRGTLKDLKFTGNSAGSWGWGVPLEPVYIIWSQALGKQGIKEKLERARKMGQTALFRAPSSLRSLGSLGSLEETQPALVPDTSNLAPISEPA